MYKCLLDAKADIECFVGAITLHKTASEEGWRVSLNVVLSASHYYRHESGLNCIQAALHYCTYCLQPERKVVPADTTQG